MDPKDSRDEKMKLNEGVPVFPEDEMSFSFLVKVSQDSHFFKRSKL